MKNNTSYKINRYYSDGYTTLRNPSNYGGGFVVCNQEGKVLIHKKIQKQGFTNNEAELLGVYEVLKFCSPFSKVYTDSMNTYYWIKKGESKTRKDLYKILQHCKELKNEKYIEIKWKSREQNLAGIYIEKQQFENKL